MRSVRATTLCGKRGKPEGGGNLSEMGQVDLKEKKKRLIRARRKISPRKMEEKRGLGKGGKRGSDSKN